MIAMLACLLSYWMEDWALIVARTFACGVLWMDEEPRRCWMALWDGNSTERYPGSLLNRRLKLTFYFNFGLYDCAIWVGGTVRGVK